MRIAAYYASLWVAMSKTANEAGYALCLHGSLGRDMDVVAVPWTEDCDDETTLLKKMLERHNFIEGYNTEDNTKKPHGRKAYVLVLKGGNGYYVDLSIMPRKAS